jgi:hypothetical protein
MNSTRGTKSKFNENFKSVPNVEFYWVNTFPAEIYLCILGMNEIPVGAYEGNSQVILSIVENKNRINMEFLLSRGIPW